MENNEIVLTKKMIIPNLKSSDKNSVLFELVEHVVELSSKKNNLSVSDVYSYILERENASSTGLGNKMAFPHARIPNWGDEPMLVFGFSHEGIDFNSIDKLKAHAFFMIICSIDTPYYVLKIMSSIIKRLSPHVKNNSLTLENIEAELCQKKLQTSKVILAKDIMRHSSNIVTVDTSIEEATRIMHLNKIDILPVLDEKGRFVGEISCLNVFELGMPDFFKKLPTISFVRNLDPFEKYFKVKGSLKVSDLIVKDSGAIDEDDTLIEILFQMSVKGRSKLYVVDKNQHLLGMIDRYCIIDKILFF